jgi:hypothetical protein
MPSLKHGPRQNTTESFVAKRILALLAAALVLLAVLVPAAALNLA